MKVGDAVVCHLTEDSTMAEGIIIRVEDRHYRVKVLKLSNEMHHFLRKWLLDPDGFGFCKENVKLKDTEEEW